MAYCPRCKGLMGATAVVCPRCGYDFPEDRKADWPLWVRLGVPAIFGPTRNRSHALTLFWVGIILDVISVAVALIDKHSLWGVVPITLATAWCGLAIRWVDKRGRWPEVG